MIGPQTEEPSISCINPSLTCPYPWPPRSGGRWVAQSFWRLTSSCSGRMARMNPLSSVSRTSRGYTSSCMNLRIHSSLASNSGSVEKSQPMRFSLHTPTEKADALVDHAHDRIRQALVHGVRPSAAAVQHEVVAEDRRVLVEAHRRIPPHLVGCDAVQAHEILDRQVNRAPWIRGVTVLAPDGHHGQAA